MTKTFANLQELAARKNIVCERTGRKIELTTPDGSVTAECDSVAEAFDTLTGDSTFSDWPTVREVATTKVVELARKVVLADEAILEAVSLQQPSDKPFLARGVAIDELRAAIAQLDK